MIKLIAVLFLVSFGFTYSQEIYFSQSHTDEGEPIGVQNKWTFGIDGGFVYIILDNEEPLGDPLLYVFIDKDIDGEYKPYDSKLLRVKNEETWAAVNYQFLENGKYKVYFMNSSQTEIASSTVEISINISSIPARENITSRYYDRVEFLFCEVVINGKPYNLLSSTSIEESQGEVFVYIRNTDSLNTDTISVDCWESTKYDNEFDNFVQSKKYKIDSSWPDTYFKYKFTKPGFYQLSIYNEKGVLIKSNFIRVYK